MGAPDDERWAAATGLVAVAAVGVIALAGGLPDDAAHGVWWVAYGVVALASVLDSELVGPPVRRRLAHVLLAVEVVAALVAWFVAPHVGWTAILLIVTAVTAAYLLTPPATWALVAVQCAAIATGIALSGGSTGDAVIMTVAYGSFQVFACLVVIGARREADGRAALARAHAELRAASALLATSARDAERLRISRDLHDVVGHQLTALALELEVASHHADGAAAHHVGRAREVARDLLADVRAAVGGLRTEVDGLEGALREAVGRPVGLEVRLAVDEEVPVAPDTALVLVRCAQELVTNASRHARARTLELAVRSDATGVTLTAHDDGAGAPRFTPGNGLTGMTERVTELGGRIDLDPAPGRGFTATVQVPA